jgi:ABC-type lipoprotein export system ATPase subunit
MMKIMELLKEMVTKKGLTLVVVTHDPRIVQFADKIDLLEDGKIVK